MTSSSSLKILAIPVAVVCLMSTALMVVVSKEPSPDDSIVLDVEIPEKWDKNYNENVADYSILEDYFTTDWSTVNASETWQEVKTTATMTYMETFSAEPKLSHMTAEDMRLAQLGEQDAWKEISNGLFQDYLTGDYTMYMSQLQEIKNTNTETVTVDVWYWENPDDIYDMRKTTKTYTFAINSVLADTFRHIFADIYDDPSQPIINLADRGMGTWVLRGKRSNTSGSPSAHALGCAMDINPSTGSFKVDGVWYGNAYGQHAMPKSIWEQLPECHAKYHTLYVGCPIVEIFKSYGFYWGGDWTSPRDAMHLAYVGDGGGRKTGTSNYNSRR